MAKKTFAEKAAKLEEELAAATEMNHNLVTEVQYLIESLADEVRDNLKAIRALTYTVLNRHPSTELQRAEILAWLYSQLLQIAKDFTYGLHEAYDHCGREKFLHFYGIAIPVARQSMDAVIRHLGKQYIYLQGIIEGLNRKEPNQ